MSGPEGGFLAYGTSCHVSASPLFTPAIARMCIHVLDAINATDRLACTRDDSRESPAFRSAAPRRSMLSVDSGRHPPALREEPDQLVRPRYRHLPRDELVFCALDCLLPLSPVG